MGRVKPAPAGLFSVKEVASATKGRFSKDAIWAAIRNGTWKRLSGLGPEGSYEVRGRTPYITPRGKRRLVELAGKYDVPVIGLAKELGVTKGALLGDPRVDTWNIDGHAYTTGGIRDKRLAEKQAMGRTVSAAEAGKRWGGRGRATVERWAAEKAVPHQRIGRRIRIPVDWADKNAKRLDRDASRYAFSKKVRKAAKTHSESPQVAKTDYGERMERCYDVAKKFIDANGRPATRKELIEMLSEHHPNKGREWVESKYGSQKADFNPLLAFADRDIEGLNFERGRLRRARVDMVEVIKRRHSRWWRRLPDAEKKSRTEGLKVASAEYWDGNRTKGRHPRLSKSMGVYLGSQAVMREEEWERQGIAPICTGDVGKRDAAVADTRTPDKEVINAEMLSNLNAALSKLDEKTRAVVLSAHIDGGISNIQRISKEVGGMRTAEIKRRYSEGMLRIRKEMAAKYGDEVKEVA